METRSLRPALSERVTRRRAGWSGVIGAGLTVLTLVASLVLFEGFDWGRHDLSTLGHVDLASAEQSFYMFNIGLAVTAMFGIVFAIGLFRIERRPLWQVGVILYAVSHVSVMWQALFPAGVPQHNWLSIFPFFALSLLILGLDQVRGAGTRLYGITILSNLLVGTIAAGLLAQTGIEGWAIHEMVGVTVFLIATILFATRLLEWV